MNRKLLPLCAVGYLWIFCLTSIVDPAETAPDIPKDVWEQIHACKTNEEFINRFVSKKPPKGMQLQPVDKLLYPNDTTVTGSFNQEGVATIVNMIAEVDGCSPRDSTVTIPTNGDSSVVYWPTCTKIQRCGGCCGSDMLACSPTRTDMQSLQVMKVKYTSDGNFEWSGLVTVQLERHLACDCQCRVQAHHCNAAKQDYDEQSCSCKCKNAADATSCPSHKKWDEKECACICPRVINCLDDEYFNYASCTCQRGLPAAAVAQNPCASQSCRAGYSAVQSGTSCVCRPSGPTNG